MKRKIKGDEVAMFVMYVLILVMALLIPIGLISDSKNIKAHRALKERELDLQERKIEAIEKAAENGIKINLIGD